MDRAFFSLSFVKEASLSSRLIKAVLHLKAGDTICLDQLLETSHLCVLSKMAAMILSSPMSMAQTMLSVEDASTSTRPDKKRLAIREYPRPSSPRRLRFYFDNTD
jgi:hypothetical protein